MSIFIGLYFYRATEKDCLWEYFLYNFVAQAVFILLNYDNFISKIGGSDDSLKHTITAPDFDYASPILDFSIFRGQNRHFCPRLVSFEHQTRA